MLRSSQAGALMALATLVSSTVFAGESWPGFRGPESRGVSEAGPLPTELGNPDSRRWRTELPPGFSSPVTAKGRLYVTAYEGDRLLTLCVDARTGAVLWRREAPRARTTKRPVNTPVSSTPATDGDRVYVLFEDFGLLAYDADGRERWRQPLGPFKLPYGLGSSPVVAGGKLIVLIDQDQGSFLAAFHAKDGRPAWRTERPDAQHGFSTPVVYRPPRGPAQVLVLGSHRLTGYALATGRELWRVAGMAWQAKCTPVVEGDRVYVNSSMPNLSELDKREALPPFAEVIQGKDADHDGKLAEAEAPVEAMKKLWFLYDLDKDGLLDEREWRVARSRDEAKSGLYAVKLGGQGDVTGSHVLWRHERSLPNLPTPLVYRDVLYVLREGGILTALDAATGKVLKQARLEGALDSYAASPVAGDGKLYFASQAGKVTIVKAAAEWEIIGVHDLGEEIWATPALAGRRLFIRTQKALYCFAGQDGGRKRVGSPAGGSTGSGRG